MAFESEIPPLIWNDPRWLEGAEAWARETLESLGCRVTGAIDQPHIRPWSSALTVPTERGVVWFKAAIPELAHEVATLEIMSARGIRAIPSYIAGDRDRGWLLIDDAGRRLRELEPRDLAHWEQAVAIYAQLQLDVSVDADAFVAAGVPDRRGPLLGEQLRALLNDEHVLQLDSDARLLDGEIRLLGTRAIDSVEAAVRELDAVGAPASIQHDDLHDANVFVSDDEYRIIDWGDASIANPLLSIDLTVRVAADIFELTPSSPELQRLRDAYFEPFTLLAPRSELRRLEGAISRAAEASGAVKWYELSRAIPEWSERLYGDALPRKLRRLLELCA